MPATTTTTTTLTTTLTYSINERWEGGTEWMLPNQMGSIVGNAMGDYTVYHRSYSCRDFDTFEQAEEWLIVILKQELRSANEQVERAAKKAKEICEVLVP
jgi:hypothetical protein